MADPCSLGVSMEQRPRLGELLVAAGVIDAAALEGALAKQRTQGGRIGKILLEAGALSEETLVRTLARQLSMPVAWLRDKQVKPDVLAHLPGHVALKHRCLPVLIDQRGTDTLLVAMEDPSDTAALDEFAIAAGCPVRVVLAAPSELDDALARHYPGEEEPELLLVDPLAGKTEAATEPPAFDLAAPADESLDLGSDLDLDAPAQGGVDLESDALDLEADTDTGGRPADSLDAAIDDVRTVGRERAAQVDAQSDADADTGTDLDIGADLDAGADLDIGPDLDTGAERSRSAPHAAQLDGSEQDPARGREVLPRDPELRAVVLLLIEGGLLSRDELALRLRAARSAGDSES